MSRARLLAGAALIAAAILAVGEVVARLLG